MFLNRFFNYPINMSKTNTPITFTLQRSAAAVAVAVTLAISGCAITPVSVTKADIQARAIADVTTAFSGQEPLSKPLTLADAIARALKYNYDDRLKQMELALNISNVEVAEKQMLPQLAVSAGYAARDNDAGSSSRSLLTGAQSLVSSTSEDRYRQQYSAIMSWNVLDFGVSYVRAQQTGNQVLIAEERRRKVVQNIINDVRYAYWRAAGAQMMLAELGQLQQRAGAALSRSRNIEDGRLTPPLQALGYQRALLDIVQLIAARRQELLQARTELSALLSIRPGTQFTLDVPKVLPDLPPVPGDIAALENDALQNRPELQEEDYRRRISVLEGRRVLLSMLPGLDLSYGRRYDSNSYLFNNDWNSSAVTLTGNLMKAFSAPALNRNSDALVRVDDTRRVALTIAVLAQVRMSVQRYDQVLQELDNSRRSLEVDGRVRRIVESTVKASAESELELIRAEARNVLSRVQHYSTYAIAQSAYGRILNSAGMEYLPPGADKQELSVLAGQVAAEINARSKGIHVKPEAAPVKLAVYVDSAKSGEFDVSSVLRTRLKGAGFEIASQPASGVSRLTPEITVSKGSVQGLGTANLVWRIAAADGKQIRQVPLSVALAQSADQGVFEALAVAGAERVISVLSSRGITSEPAGVIQ